MLAFNRLAFASAVLLAIPLAARAQDGVIVYRLGKDTAAIESFTRTPTRFAGEMALRAGPVVQRVQYEMALANGRPTSSVLRLMQGNGSPMPNMPTEWRFTFRADSAIRTTVWPDSTQRQAVAAANAFMAMPVFAYGPLELLYALRSKGAKVDSIPSIPLRGGNSVLVGLETLGGDTLRLRGGFYPMLLFFDKQGRLMRVDGSLTTNKSVGTREEGKADVAAIARAMKPTGVLSPRQTAYAGFNQGPILINYGSPAVRGRTVWGGTLVPFDTVWRLGANEATHLATSKTIQLGDMTLTPGMYTLFLQHTKNGTFLIVNRQVGQWGTVHDPAQDIGRVAMEMKDAPHWAEDLAITLRPAGPGRGAIDVAWGDKVATAGFAVR